MRTYLLPLAGLLSFTLSACGQAPDATARQPAAVPVEQQDPTGAMKIRISIDGRAFTFNLTDDRTARELIGTLPFEGSASVYHGNHYYLLTPKGLSVEGLKPTRDAKQGHLVYSAEYNGLGIFFADGHFDENELFYIGEAEEDMSGLDTAKAVQIKVEGVPSK